MGLQLYDTGSELTVELDGEGHIADGVDGRIDERLKGVAAFMLEDSRAELGQMVLSTRWSRCGPC